MSAQTPTGSWTIRRPDRRVVLVDDAIVVVRRRGPRSSGSSGRRRRCPSGSRAWPCRSGASPRGPSPRGRGRSARRRGSRRAARSAPVVRGQSPVSKARRAAAIGGLDLVVGRDVHLGDDRAVGGVDHGAARAVARGDPRTVDEQVRQRVPSLDRRADWGARVGVAHPSSRRRTACQAGRVHPARTPRYPSMVDPTRPDGADRHPSPHPDRLWRHPEPKPAYDVVIIGGGGHGLAAAYYLAREHGITDVAVVERGWLAGGNIARNTAIIRSNYLLGRERGDLRARRSSCGRRCAEELDYDLLFSQRGGMNLAHNLGDVREGMRRVNANRLNGIDAEWLTPDDVTRICPILERRRRRPLPDPGRDLPAARRHRQARPRRVGLRAGRRRARRRPHRGRRGDRHRHRGRSGHRRPDVARADRRRAGRDRGGRSRLDRSRRWPGIRLPLQSHPLQALVSELLEPVAADAS